MKRKIRVAFVYHPCKSLTNTYHFTTGYNFFMNALKRNKQIDISFIKSENIFDVKTINKNFDIVLLYENANTGDTCVPETFTNIEKLELPVISKVGDPQRAKEFSPEKYHEKYKINAYFGLTHEDIFYKYYPKKFKYKVVIYGLEPTLFQTVSPFNSRKSAKILNSGAVASLKLRNRLFCKLTKGDSDPMIHYKLRTLCNKLPYVDYTSPLEHEYRGDKYTQLLQKYRASIAATTTYPTMKYLEIPASGCLTFMEITKNNRGSYLGFEDEKNAIFINEKNYQEKFESYLSDANNPKWEEIANSGREYVMNNLTNDHAVNSLVELMEEFV
jgi:hypothetical protein